MLQYRHSSGLLQSFSPAYQDDHDASHGRPFSFAGLPASHEARMRRCRRRISRAEGSAWLSPPFGQIPRWNGVKPAPCLPAKPTKNIITLSLALNKPIFAFNPHQKTFLCIAQRKVFECREIQKPQVSGGVRGSVPHVPSFTGYAPAAHESRSAQPAPSRRRRRKSRPTCSRCPVRRAPGRQT